MAISELTHPHIPGRLSASLPNLPPEIQLLIFEELDANFSVWLGLTCKKFCAIHWKIHRQVKMFWRPKVKDAGLNALLASWMGTKYDIMTLHTSPREDIIKVRDDSFGGKVMRGSMRAVITLVTMWEGRAFIELHCSGVDAKEWNPWRRSLLEGLPKLNIDNRKSCNLRGQSISTTAVSAIAHLGMSSCTFSCKLASYFPPSDFDRELDFAKSLF